MAEITIKDLRLSFVYFKNKGKTALADFFQLEDVSSHTVKNNKNKKKIKKSEQNFEDFIRKDE